MLARAALQELELWPDWSGEIAAVIASGPSANQADVDKLRGRARVLAIKQSIELCPWADAVYGCDAHWWQYRRGLPEFNGLKISHRKPGVTLDPSIRLIDIETSQDKIYPVELRKYRMQFDKTGLIGNGGNSGYQAVNLAAQFGAYRIILVGFDMHDRGELHWYGRNNWRSASNPDETNFCRWRVALGDAAKHLAQRGVEVINTSPNSKLDCFPKMTVEQALQ